MRWPKSSSSQSRVNRDFSIFDNLYVYEREHRLAGGEAEPRSWFVWNEVVYNSFRAGYLKSLDWGLYCSLKDPIAKRLYRFLDKRFYREEKLAFDLHELAFHKVRVSRSYNTAQVKGALQKGIRELEAVWELRPMSADQRFLKLGRGRWQAVFERKRKRTKAKRSSEPGHPLAQQLLERGVARDSAERVVQEAPAERIEAMLELFDWHAERGNPRSPGFVVAGIRSPEGFTPPPGFESNAQRQKREAARKSRIAAERSIQAQREEEATRKDKTRQEAFTAFWCKLGDQEQNRFFNDALDNADRTKLDGYRRAQKHGGVLLEHYRAVILRQHFERTKGEGT
ncbi:MAG: hypothetical protein ACQESR_12775 [Planctomycetota bacterium]